MSTEYRCEISVTSSTYRGDRDERLTVFTVSGHGHTENAAIHHALTNMTQLGHDPERIKESHAER